MTTLIEIEMQRLVICHELDLKLKDIQNGVFNGVNGLPPDFSGDFVGIEEHLLVNLCDDDYNDGATSLTT